jgi:epoxyqueuosine reductase
VSNVKCTSAEWTSKDHLWLHQQAIDAGFDTAGVASVDPAASPEASQLDAERFTAWVAEGRAGEMEYLKRRDEQGTLLRSAVQRVIPWARSVVVCAFDYNAAGPLSIDPAPPNTGWIARYAWSGATSTTSTEDLNSTAADLLPTDYHDQLLSRLRQVEASLHQRFDCETRCYVDTGPIVERALAARAGIGWIGKNTCVINQQHGSWLLLGVVITSIPIASAAALAPAADRCGTCTRCIDACPTDALIAPRQMDATRCIAYLTIEKKGAIPVDLRAPIGRQVFGCDICQDVCPWNRKTNQTSIIGKTSPQQSVTQTSTHQPDGMLPRPQLINPALDWLAGMDATSFKRWFKGSPIERTRRKRLHRNVAIAMGNTGDRQFLPQLKSWAAAEVEDPTLAEAATWAISQITK